MAELNNLNMKRLPVVIGIFLALAGFAYAQDTQVTASIGSDSVGVQDQFQLSITVSGKDSGDAEAPRFTSLKEFRIVSGPNVSSQFQWINGRTNSSKSFIYILIPEKEGQFTIDPVEVRVGGKVYKTQPLPIRVTSATPRSAPQQRQRTPAPLNPFDPFGEDEDIAPSRPAADTVLMKAELDRNSAYPGQQVTLSYRLYTQVGISGIQLQENPPLSGFWVEDLEVEKNPKGSHQVINGREYVVFTIKKQALFANGSGKLRIPSSIFAISAQAGGSVFGVFSRPETLYRKTQELQLDVKPFPSSGRPADFNNAVGSYRLSSSVDKNQVATGEAIALQVKLEGQGNLKMIPDISLPGLPDLTVYSSKHTDNMHPSAEDQIGGSKTWEYVLVPKAPGRQTIPEIAFSFFNPQQEKYETVRTAAIDLTVARGTENTISGLSGSDKQDLVRRGTDINFIKLNADILPREGTPFHRSYWMFILAAIPLAVNAGLIINQKRQSRFLLDSASFRNRRARRMALQRLGDAGKDAQEDPRRFYDVAAAALSGYISDRFSLTEIDLTGDNLERSLAQKSIPPGTIQETMACLQECDFGRFVSASASEEKIRELMARIRANVDDLERNSTSTSTSRLRA